MMDPHTAYFFKKYYRNIIKWYFVMYNPEVIRIWPSKAEEREALRREEQERLEKEAEAAKEYEADTLSENETMSSETDEYFDSYDDSLQGTDIFDDSYTDNPDEYEEGAYNATTGSYSGLYGQKPVDADTQAALDAIMNKNTSSQDNVDYLLSGSKTSTDAAYSLNDSAYNENKSNKLLLEEADIPPEQEEIVKEANLIYERLMREAAEDEAKNRAEIEEAVKIAEQKFLT